MINISLPVKEISTDITLLDAPEHWRVSNHHPEQTRELISHRITNIFGLTQALVEFECTFRIIISQTIHG